MCVPHRSDSLSLLIVEDNRDAADSLADLLRLCGHRVAVARTARQALEWTDHNHPDVVLLDIHLPDLNGWQLARWLREQARLKGRPDGPFLLAITGGRTEADRHQSVQAGIDLHLVKPAEPKLLIALLDELQREKCSQ